MPISFRAKSCLLFWGMNQSEDDPSIWSKNLGCGPYEASIVIRITCQKVVLYFSNMEKTTKLSESPNARFYWVERAAKRASNDLRSLFLDYVKDKTFDLLTRRGFATSNNRDWMKCSRYVHNVYLIRVHMTDKYTMSWTAMSSTGEIVDEDEDNIFNAEDVIDDMEASILQRDRVLPVMPRVMEPVV